MLRIKNRTKKALFSLATILTLGLLGPGVSASENSGVSNKADFSTDTIYQILTDRFKDGNAGNNGSSDVYDPSNPRKYHGGDWQGVTDKINDGYLTGMGISAIWVSSPVENLDLIDPSNGSAAYHGYWGRDFFKTNSHFGTFDDFKNMVDTAHSKGIKVVIDFAPNHTSTAEYGNLQFPDDGALYKDGVKLGSLRNDPNNLFNHEPWTDFSTYENGIYHSMYGLADLNNVNPTVDTYMKESIQKWLGMGIDGIRVDAVKHMSLGWQKNWLSDIYEKNNVFVFGEWFAGGTSGEADMNKFVNTSGMSLLDFRFANSVRSLYTNPSYTMGDFYSVLKATESEYNEVSDQVTFIDNHDMPRFSTITNGNDTALNQAYALLLTSRGVPNLYYGSEQYAKGGEDPQNRGDIPSFNNTTKAYKIISKLAPLRKQNQALAYGGTEERWVNNDVIVYERKFGNDVAIVAVNKSQSQNFNIGGTLTSLPTGIYKDKLDGLMGGGQLTIDKSGKVGSYELKAGQTAVWTVENKSTEPQIGNVGASIGISGNEISISGQAFGAQTGQVLFGNTAANVTLWTDTLIKVNVPDGLVGYQNIAIRNSNGALSNTFNNFEILSDKQIPVRLMVNNFNTNLGEELYIVGDVAELGMNKLEDAVGPIFNGTESIAKYPNWFYDVNLPVNKTITCRLVKKDGQGNILWTSNSYVIKTGDKAATLYIKDK
ncbi:alpha-amylase [Floricoccus tropicus]|uniref:Alpha-amylase n=1 Tax=Floricoccus tropicus TaxID=1859473 RepID=A0A1E8GMV5_9LACT|nr:alpha-amylase family glycosyl hydrolase [Floricoccus tropicus]OFI49579.1 alpha-amylase [Floricoccus tropicus]